MNAKMGDRAGCTKLDRTNGFDDGRDYMRVKKSKLAQQNDQIRDALRHRHNTFKSDLFKGISINVNGRTQPTADELKRLILLNGGDYHPYYRYQTTKFMIATNLSMARIKQLRPDDRVIRPEWITESIQAKCLLPYQDYQIFFEEPRGKTGSVLSISDGVAETSGVLPTSSTIKDDDVQLISVVDSYSKNYRKSKQRSDRDRTESKSRDIREMFSKSVRSIDNGEKRKSSSQSSNDNSNLSETSNSNQESFQKKPSKQGTIADFVTKGARPHRFPTPKVSEKKYEANIRGLTRIDDIIGFFNEWVGCPDGITDEDTAHVTKYFYDLMSEKSYHNKFYEIIGAFHQRVVQHNEASWINLYNSLISTMKSELDQEIEASRNLSQLLNLIDVDSQ